MTPMNVGGAGGDLASRRFALVVTIALTVLALPPLQISPSTLKLASLLAGMSGAFFLMAGLVFLQKTHHAGIMLIASASGVMALSQVGGRLEAFLIGLVFAVAIARSSLTLRCAINQVLGIDSIHRPRAQDAEPH